MKNVIKNLFALSLLFGIGITGVDARTELVEDEAQLRTIADGLDTDITEIKLNNDITLTKYLEIYVGDRELTFDLAGHTLDCSDTSCQFIYGGVKSSSTTYYTTGSLTLTDSSNSNEGKIIFNHYLDFEPISGMTDKDTPKNYKLTIDGGTYIKKEFTGYTMHMITLFGYTGAVDGFNITVDFNLKNGTFIADTDKNLYVFRTNPTNVSDVKMNLNIENMYAKGNNLKLSNNLFGNTPIEDVISSKYLIYNTILDNGVLKEEEVTDRTLTIKDIKTAEDDNGYFKIEKAHGFRLDPITFNASYGYNDLVKYNLNIKNIGEESLVIKNITLSNSDNFNITSTTGFNKTVAGGETNAEFILEAAPYLKVGEYTTDIIIEDADSNKYYGTATFTVDKKDVNLGVTIDNWTYGETPSEPIFTGTNYDDKQYLNITYREVGTSTYTSTKPVNAGKYEIKVTIDNENYIPKEVTKEFEIFKTDKEVKIVANSSSHEYDGNDYTDSGYKVYFNGVESTDGKLYYNDCVGNVKISGSVKDVVDNTPNNNIIDSSLIEITNKDNYSNIVVENGTISITPITTPITVTAESDSKKYDGEPLTNDRYTYTEDVLLPGDNLSATVTGSILYAGSTPNVVSNVKVTRDNKDITSNYTFNENVDGLLELNSSNQLLTVTDTLYVRINTTTSITKILEKLNSSISNITLKYISGNAGTYDDNGFTAGTTTGQVKMEAIAPAIDLNGDNVPEYGETGTTFFINVIEKDALTINGLTNNEKFTYDGNKHTPTGTIEVENNLVPTSELEVIYKDVSTLEELNEAPTKAGKYTVTYKIADSNPNYKGSITYSFIINKAQLNKPTASTTSFEYDGTSKGFSSFHDSKLFEFTGVNTATNVGNYAITIALKDKDNYEWIDGTTSDVVINWSITKATPEYTIPTYLVGVKNNILNDIILNDRFTWNNPDTVLMPGTHTFKATYTPVDTDNYKTITDIDITVYVKDIFTINGNVLGGNGNIEIPNNSIIEGNTTSITLIPETGYMIDKVLVNGIQVEVNNNVLELLMNENKTVDVTYKKIPFNIKVVDNKNATVTPNGVVVVNYGDSQDFEIIANKGYKLIKALVNNEDKTNELVNNKLTLSNITSDKVVEVVVEKITYEVIEGANQNYTITKNTEAKFRIDADYNLFNQLVYVDNILVDSKYYTTESGSTIITLKKEYLDTLKAGEHTLMVTFSDGGESTTKFTISNIDNSSTPKTLDNINTYIISLLGASTVLLTIVYYKKKKTI